MIVFGLLLIVVSAGAVAFAVMAPSADAQTIELSALGVTVSATPLAMFVGGALAVLLLTLGFGLVNRGARRRVSSRREIRELRKGQADAAAQQGTESGRHSSGHERPSEDTHIEGESSSGTGSDGTNAESASGPETRTTSGTRVDPTP